jgi:hypothetical protein
VTVTVAGNVLPDAFGNVLSGAASSAVTVKTQPSAAVQTTAVRPGRCFPPRNLTHFGASSYRQYDEYSVYLD